LTDELDQLPNLHAVTYHLPEVAYLYGNLLVINCLPDEMKHRLFKQWVLHTDYIDLSSAFLQHELVKQALRSLANPTPGFERTLEQELLSSALPAAVASIPELVDAIYCSHELEPAPQRASDVCSFNGRQVRNIPHRSVSPQTCRLHLYL
jgi:hypothetical protein